MCSADVLTGQCMWMELKVIKLIDSVVMRRQIKPHISR